MGDFPELMHTAIDAPDAWELAEFYRQLLGLHYRGEGPSEDADWIVLLDDAGRRVLTVQLKPDMKRSTWPSEEVPMQMHMDFEVPSVSELERHRERAEALGATVVMDRTSDPDEPLYVLTDPAGHPFCLLAVSR